MPLLISIRLTNADPGWAPIGSVQDLGRLKEVVGIGVCFRGGFKFAGVAGCFTHQPMYNTSSSVKVLGVGDRMMWISELGVSTASPRGQDSLVRLVHRHRNWIPPLPLDERVHADTQVTEPSRNVASCPDASGAIALASIVVVDLLLPEGFGCLAFRWIGFRVWGDGEGGKGDGG
jgi:hypothetical protein